MTHSDKRAPSLGETVLVLLAMTATTTIALYGIPESLQSALSLGTPPIENAAGPYGEVDTRSQIYPLAKQVSNIVFASNVVHCDGTAVVPVADQRGFRILLQRDKTRGQRDFTSRGDWEFADIVLVPTGNLPPPPVSTIMWDTSDPEDLMRPVYMGVGEGFHWYGHMEMGQQDHLRTTMKLEGGEERFNLLVESIEHATSRRDRGIAIRNLANVFGDRALPILLREVHNPQLDSVDFAIHALGMVNSEKSIDALLRLYESPDTKVRARAALSSTFSPLAKQAYLDNLSIESSEKPFYIASIRAAIQHDWKEAVPLLEEIKSAPYSPLYYIDSSLAIRTLNGNPASEDLLTHQQVIRDLCCGSRPDEVESAYRALLSHPDRHGALLMAIKLATAEGKGSRRPSELGVELLKTLPLETVLPVLEHLRTTLYDERARDRLSDIYHEVKGLEMQNIALRTAPRPIG